MNMKCTICIRNSVGVGCRFSFMKMLNTDLHREPGRDHAIQKIVFYNMNTVVSS